MLKKFWIKFLTLSENFKQNFEKVFNNVQGNFQKFYVSENHQMFKISKKFLRKFDENTFLEKQLRNVR